MARTPALRAFSQRQIIAALVVGAALRLLLLPGPGSVDVGTWKTWAFAGSSDPTTLYGVGGTPPERRQLRWQNVRGTTEYPPLALYELSAVGRVYQAIDSTFSDTTLLTILVKSPGLLAEMAFVGALLYWRPRPLGDATDWIVMAFWLNPAVIINGVGLGYLDAQMAVPAALAVVAGASGAFATAGALMAAAVLTKPQALFAAPALALLWWRVAPRARGRLLMRALAGAVTVAALVLGPIIARGAGQNMLQALGRLGAHDMLSAFALNVWWLVTWVLRALPGLDAGWVVAFTRPVRILNISRMLELGYPNPRPIGIALVGVCVLWAVWRSRHGRSLGGGALVGAWLVYAYAMFSAQVHENHAYLAIPLLVLAAGIAPELRRLFWLISAMTAVNMYLFYGAGSTWVPMIDRRWTGVDMSVLLAAGNVCLFGWFTRCVWWLPTTRPIYAPAAEASGSAVTVSTNVSSRLSDW